MFLFCISTGRCLRQPLASSHRRIDHLNTQTEYVVDCWTAAEGGGIRFLSSCGSILPSLGARSPARYFKNQAWSPVKARCASCITESLLRRLDSLMECSSSNLVLVDDLVSYSCRSARSVEDQETSFCGFGIDAPVGMKNPTSGNLELCLMPLLSYQANLPLSWSIRGALDITKIFWCDQNAMRKSETIQSFYPDWYQPCIILASSIWSRSVAIRQTLDQLCSKW